MAKFKCLFWTCCKNQWLYIYNDWKQSWLLNIGLTSILMALLILIIYFPSELESLDHLTLGKFVILMSLLFCLILNILGLIIVSLYWCYKSFTQRYKETEEACLEELHIA